MGIHSTDGWESGQIQMNFRERILWLYPNGRAPITALTGRMGTEPTQSYRIDYYVQSMAEQGGLMQGSGLYLENTLTTAVTGTTTAAGTILFAKVRDTEARGYACAGEFIPGHEVVLRYSVDSEVDKTAKVLAVQKNGTSSYITLQLHETDAVTTVGGYSLADADEIYIIGTSNPEGGMPPMSVNYVPTAYGNLTQIFKTVLEISGTNLQQFVEAGEAGLLKLKNKRRLAAERHAVEMERAFIWGVKSSGTGENNAPERRMDGILKFIRTYASGNIGNFALDTTYSGQTWLQGGYGWLEAMLQPIFRYGEAKERIGFCGDTALIQINRLIRSMGWEQLTPQTKVFGIQVFDWMSPAGIIHLWTHPLFSQMASMRKSMLLYDPTDVIYRPFSGRDTVKKDVTPVGFDGYMEQLMTECTLELHFPEKFGFLSGIGSDNNV